MVNQQANHICGPFQSSYLALEIDNGLQHRHLSHAIDVSCFRTWCKTDVYFSRDENTQRILLFCLSS